MIATITNSRVRREQFEVLMLKEDIIYFRYFEDRHIDVGDMIDSFEIHDKLTKTAAVKRIVHMEQYSTISKKARELVQFHGKPAKAEAFVIPSIGQKILYNLFFKLRREKHPLKAFDKLEDAIAWLDQQ